MSLEESSGLERESLVDPPNGEKALEEESDASAAAPSGALVPVGGRSLAATDPLRRYIAEVRRYAPLDREEEQRLARLYRETGDRDALFRLVTSNLMLVVRIALSFRRAVQSVLDLVQEGNVGLMQALERFDPDLGVRLPTYAAWWIRAYIVKFLLDNVRQVRVGTTNARRKLLHNLAQERRRLEAEGFEVGPKLLAERFGVSEGDVRDVEQALASRDVRLDEPVGEDGERTRADALAAGGPTVEEQVARRELGEKVQASIRRFRGGLSDRDRAILDDRILSEDPLTLQALGERFGTTREAVRQAEVKLMNRLKAHLAEELGDLGSIRIGPA
ncbi:MAG: sigma-70 family RNA polymerase sigma factor [Acidobacteriia bacterium]|nr:sigma-70 family RNA polymerase sigma factor [Terriglobia bacterium]